MNFESDTNIWFL